MGNEATSSGEFYYSSIITVTIIIIIIIIIIFIIIIITIIIVVIFLWNGWHRLLKQWASNDNSISKRQRGARNENKSATS